MCYEQELRSLFLFDSMVTFDPSMPVNSGMLLDHSELDRAQVKDKMIWLRSEKGYGGRFMKNRNITALLPGSSKVVQAPVDAT